MDCKRARLILGEYLDAGENRSGFENLAAHLAACAACANELNRERRIRLYLSRFPTVEPKESLAPRILARLDAPRPFPKLAYWSAMAGVVAFILIAAAAGATFVKWFRPPESEPALPAIIQQEGGPEIVKAAPDDKTIGSPQVHSDLPGRYAKVPMRVEEFLVDLLQTSQKVPAKAKLLQAIVEQTDLLEGSYESFEGEGGEPTVYLNRKQMRVQIELVITQQDFLDFARAYNLIGALMAAEKAGQRVKLYETSPTMELVRAEIRFKTADSRQ